MPVKPPRRSYLVRATRGCALMVCLATSLLAVGCSGASPDQGVSPLQDGTPTTIDPSLPTDADHSVEPEESGHDASDPNPRDRTQVADADQEVALLLGRFDAAISALYAEPLAAGDDHHPLSVAWLGVVVGGSQLDRQVRGRILASGTEDGMRIVPDAGGVSFENVAIDLTEESDGSLTWTNCGYAPGIGVDLETGVVLDDNRTSTRGRGRAVRDSDGTLSISELWDDESHVLAPGEPDPCTALADHATGGS